MQCYLLAKSRTVGRFEKDTLQHKKEHCTLDGRHTLRGTPHAL
jgi:hypothetical protein